MYSHRLWEPSNVFRGCHSQKDKGNEHTCLPDVGQLYFSADGVWCLTNLFAWERLTGGGDPLQTLHSAIAGGVVRAYRWHPIDIPVRSAIVYDR